MRVLGTKRLIGYLVALVGFVITLLVTPYSVSDPMNLPKMAGLVLLTGAISTLLLPQKEFYRTLKTEPIFILTLVFFLVLMNTLGRAGIRLSENFYGTAGRNTGVLTYVAFLILMLGCVYVAQEEFMKRMTVTFIVTGLILLVYGNFQYFGLEPFPYISAYESEVIGTFGNPNFQSAFLGMLGVICTTLVFDKTLNKFFRISLLFTTLFSIIGIYQTNSIQGFLNLVIGLSFVAFIFFLAKNWKKLAYFTGFSIFTGFLLIVFSFFNVGPLAEILFKSSVSARVYYWKVAIEITKDYPLFGVGMDQYVDWLRRYRTAADVVIDVTSDSAHNIYLDLAASGGIPLLLTYSSITILTLRSIIRVLRRNPASDFYYFAIVGGWVAYQAQSVVSISQIGVAVWGWIFSGLLIGYEINTRNPSTIQVASKRRNLHKEQKAKSIDSRVVGVACLGLICGSVTIYQPWTSAREYYNAFKTSDARVIKDAAFLKPYNRTSFLQVAGILWSNKFDKDALDVAKEGVVHFPNSYTLWKLVADLSAVDSQEKLTAIKRLHELDPNNPAFAQPK